MMSTSIFFSFGIFISILLCISCSSIHHSAGDMSYQEKDLSYYNQYNSNEDDDVPMMVYPKSLIYRIQRSSLFHPRESRNSWFRVSTYQHMKPPGGPEEKPAGDNLMRWG
jgi:hypothetical protein